MYCTPENVIARYGEAELLRVAAVEAEEEDAEPQIDVDVLEAACRVATALIDSEIEIPAGVRLPADLRSRAVEIAFYRLLVLKGTMQPGAARVYRNAVSFLESIRSGKRELKFEPLPTPKRRRRTRTRTKPEEPVARATPAAAEEPPAEE